MLNRFPLNVKLSCTQQSMKRRCCKFCTPDGIFWGGQLEAFEKEFAAYLGAKHCVGVGNGLDALTLAIRALGIGVGDEVIVPSNTYIASVLGITENKATPIFIEPDEFFNIDADKIEAAITEKTKAILPVHLYGQACDMKRICAIAEKYDLKVVEDCAQSHGAMSGGKLTGTLGNIGCFSFYPTKPLGGFGDGGAVVTDDDELAERLRKLRNYGSSKKYINDVEGTNSRLDEMQAAILRVGLKHLDEGNNYRTQIAERYLTGIKNPHIYMPKTRCSSTNVWHVFPILCKNRSKFQKYLLDNGIKTLCHYPIPPHMQQCYERLGYACGDFPIAERIAEQELSLPIYAGMPREDVDYIIKTINMYEREQDESRD